MKAIATFTRTVELEYDWAAAPIVRTWSRSDAKITRLVLKWHWDDSKQAWVRSEYGDVVSGARIKKDGTAYAEAIRLSLPAGAFRDDLLATHTPTTTISWSES